MKITARGGACPARQVFSTPEPHVSTGPDIDASRGVPVHVCDACRALFVPDHPYPPTDDTQDGAR